jgi:hypothetical protein
MKTWSFWVTIAVSVLNILLNLTRLAMVQSGEMRALIAVQTVGFVLTIVLIVLPSVQCTLTAA